MATVRKCRTDAREKPPGCLCADCLQPIGLCSCLKTRGIEVEAETLRAIDKVGLKRQPTCSGRGVLLPKAALSELEEDDLDPALDHALLPDIAEVPRKHPGIKNGVTGRQREEKERASEQEGVEGNRPDWTPDVTHSEGDGRSTGANFKPVHSVGPPQVVAVREGHKAVRVAGFFGIACLSVVVGVLWLDTSLNRTAPAAGHSERMTLGLAPAESHEATTASKGQPVASQRRDRDLEKWAERSDHRPGAGDRQRPDRERSATATGMSVEQTSGVTVGQDTQSGSSVSAGVAESSGEPARSSRRSESRTAESSRVRGEAAEPPFGGSFVAHPPRPRRPLSVPKVVRQLSSGRKGEVALLVTVDALGNPKVLSVACPPGTSRFVIERLKNSVIEVDWVAATNISGTPLPGAVTVRFEIGGGR